MALTWSLLSESTWSVRKPATSAELSLDICRVDSEPTDEAGRLEKIEVMARPFKNGACVVSKKLTADALRLSSLSLRHLKKKL
jgi:hypothetical protein